MDKKTKEKLDYEHSLKIERINLKQTNAILLLDKEKAIDRYRHEMDLERMRIKSAEIRKGMERKKAYNLN